MPKPLAVIVEDDSNLSKIFSLALQTDFEVEVYGDGSTAFMRMATADPLVVVLDLNLPGLQGKEILADIRSNPRLSKTRVILCTADEQQADELRRQADFVMIKPVSPAQLRLTANRIVAQ